MCTDELGGNWTVSSAHAPVAALGFDPEVG